MRVICAIAIISPGYLCSNDSGNRARAAGCTITNARFRSRVLCPPPLPQPHSVTIATMPATLRSRSPMRKAVCIGIEYRELAETFPTLHLPAAHMDPTIMAELLQGESWCGRFQRKVTRGSIAGGTLRYFQINTGTRPRIFKSLPTRRVPICYQREITS